MNAPALNLAAETAPALLAALRKIDITVPHITEGRRSQHRERYLMARFLATAAESQRVRYPMEVEHRDKPDFVLHLDTDRVGVECVEAVPEEWYEIEAIRERSYPDALNWGQSFKPGEKVFTAEQKVEVASGVRAGPPWVGSMAEAQWAEAMEHFIRIKTEKLRTGNYAEFPHMWLLVQDEWRVPMYSREQVEEAAALCLPRIADLQVEPCFTSIFVCSRGWLLSFEVGHFTMEPIRELWRDG